MIRIISHVENLKDRIHSQIQITKKIAELVWFYIIENLFFKNLTSTE